MKSYKDKCGRLISAIDKYVENDIVVAFSGGVDSSLILRIACDLAGQKGNLVHAFTVKTELHPLGDLEIARQVAEETGAVHHVLNVDELENAEIENNPIDRCYRCKKHLFSELKRHCEKLGIDTILDGTNGDDLHEYRPGIRALEELGILSPIADSGMTKNEVRRLAAEFGIRVADRPSSPCLATRFPYGSRLTVEKMARVEEGEAFIRKLGFYNVRLRVHEDIARIEVDSKDLVELVGRRNEVIGYLKELGYDYVVLDMEGFRSGSMDIKIIGEVK